MKKTGFLKKFIICFAVVMAMFATSKVLPVYAGDFTTAATLPTNGVWSGKYELAEGATDYYKFIISKAGEVDVKMMSYSSALYCILYDSNFKRITDIRLSGSESSPNTGSITRWLSQGTYYVSVTSGYNWGGGTYQLYALFNSSGITAADNDSYDSPQNISINSKATGVITYSNNEDWYKVSISSAGKYRYIFQYPVVTKCYLYDVNLSELYNLYGYSSGMKTGEIELKPGIYYIKIQGSDCGTYTYQLNEAIPMKGEVLNDSKNQAQYKVTKAGKKGGTVTYLKSMNGVKTSITVPATVKIDGITYKVTSIASNAFNGNGMLKKVTIGKNITSIGAKAFYNCYNLKKITVKSANLKKVGKNALKKIKATAKIKVPKKKLSAYKKLFKNKGQGKKVKIVK